MRIVLDGGPLSVESGGIRRYVEELALALRGAYPADEVHVASDHALLGTERLAEAGIRIHDRRPEGLDRRWWLWGLPSLCGRLRAHVFHGTDFSVPYLHRVPAVMTIHDLSPWMDRKWQPEAGRVRRRTPWLLRLRLADAIITVSETARREAISKFGIDESLVHAIPLAADARFSPRPARPSDTTYFLFAGTLEPRKNLPVLVSAWEPVYREFGIRLVVAGRKREDFQFDLRRPGLEWVGRVSDEELATLYSGALAAVYPSAYEGFGLPALEAMQCGAPVIVGDAAALRELVGEAAMVVDGADRAAVEGCLRRLIVHPEVREERRRLSLERAAQFHWTSTARLTRSVYEEAIARFERRAPV